VEDDVLLGVTARALRKTGNPLARAFLARACQEGVKDLCGAAPSPKTK
jgi:hypothetical protein